MRIKTVRDLSRFYVGVFGIVALTSAAGAQLASHVIVNRTPSLPLGIYWLSQGRAPSHDDLVAFAVPDNVKNLVQERHYLPPGAYLVKHVFALPGDEVCSEQGELRINGERIGPVLEHDLEGRPLPHPAICEALSEGQVFVGTRYERSFDSRSFGPIALASLKGTVTPIWTY